MSNEIKEKGAGVSRRDLLMTGGAIVGASTLSLAANKSAFAEAAKSAADASQYSTRLVLLGTGGGPVWWPKFDRQGTSSALVVGDAVYVVDLGDGFGRQYKRAALGEDNLVSGMSGMENLRAVFLTHLHSDHTISMPSLLLFGWYNGLPNIQAPVQIYGPGRRGELEPVFSPPGAPPRAEPTLINPDNPTPGTKDMFDYLTRAYALDINDRLRDSGRVELSQLFEAHDIELPDIEGFESANTTPEPDMEPFKVFEDDRIKVSATLVNHFPIWPSLAYRFDTDEGSVVFSGDTRRSENLIRMAKDCDVLVHEVIDVEWINSLFPPPVSEVQEAFKNHLIESHVSIEEVGKVAEDAGAKTLVLSHIVPGHSPYENLIRAQHDFSGQLIIGQDLMQIGIGRKRG